MQSKIADSAAFSSAFGVSRETLARLNLYESLLKEWQKHINLVAPATLAEIWHRHFADSAQLVQLVPDTAQTIVDLGSGAGFPGLVLAIMLAEEPLAGPRPGGGANSSSGRRIVLIESDRRKAAFLREVARQTRVAVEILSIRIEKPETHVRVGQADVVSARALAPLSQLLDWAAPLFGPETTGLFLKGQNARAEVEAAQAKWAFDVSFVPSVTAEDASIVVVRRLSVK